MERNDKITMFLHMLKGSFLRRKTRLFILIVSIVIASSVVSGMSTLYADIASKMEKELRTYGANLVLNKSDGTQVNGAESKMLKNYFDDEKLVGFSPNLYSTVDVGDRRFIAVGIDAGNFKKVSPYIKLAQGGGKFSIGSGEALIGKNVAINTGAKPGSILKVKDKDNLLRMKVSGIIESGGVEDDQIFMRTASLQKMSGLSGTADVIYVSYIGDHKILTEIIKKIFKENPQIRAQTINKVSKSEGKILKKITSLTWIVSLVILVSTVFCVAVTLMAMVFERRKEIGLKKALGASNRDILLEYIGESAMLGLAGGILGWVAGNILAQVISESIFNSAITVRFFTLPLAVGVSMLITGISSIFPSRLAFNIEPAIVLKDE